MAEQHAAMDAGRGFVEVDLAADFRHAALHAPIRLLGRGPARLVERHADVDLHAGRGQRHVRPPARDGAVAHRLPRERPVHLGHEVVHQAIEHPLARIGEGRVVAGRPGLRVRAARIIGPVAPDTRGTDPETHPWAGGAQLLRQPLHQQPGTVAAPVALVREALAVGGEGPCVVQARIGGFVIEVVVEVDGIHGIARRDLGHHAAQPGPHLGQPRVQHEAPGGRADPVGPGAVDAGRAVGGRAAQHAHGVRAHVHRHAVRIEPGVQLQPPRMRLLHGEGQGVESGMPAQRAGQVGRPGQEIGGVERIRARLGLEDHRIEAGGHRLVQDAQQFRLLHGDALRIVGDPGGLRGGPVQVQDRGDPAGSQGPGPREGRLRAGRARARAGPSATAFQQERRRQQGRQPGRLGEQAPAARIGEGGGGKQRGRERGHGPNSAARKIPAAMEGLAAAGCQRPVVSRRACGAPEDARRRTPWRGAGNPGAYRPGWW